MKIRSIMLTNGTFACNHRIYYHIRMNCWTILTL